MQFLNHCETCLFLSTMTTKNGNKIDVYASCEDAKRIHPINPFLIRYGNEPREYTTGNGNALFRIIENE